MMFRKLRNKRSFKAVSIVLYSGLAIIVCLMVLSLITSQQQSMTQRENRTQAQLNYSAKHSISSYHLFGQPTDKIREVRQAPWKIKGIIVQDNQTSIVIIEQNNREKMYSTGDKLDANTLIKSIERGKVLVLRDGKLQSLSIFKK